MELRKLILTLIIGLLVLGGCSKDEDESIRFSQKEYEIDFGETLEFDIQASGVSAPFEFTVDDEEVATADEDGLLTAGLVGETSVLVSKNGISDECKVTVMPTVSLYTEPLLTWGVSVQEVKDFESEKRNLESEIEDGLFYSPISEYGVRNILYSFEAGKLEGAMVLLVNSEAVVNASTDFLKQRYNSIGTSNGVIFFSRGDVTVGLTYDSDLGLVAAYVENPETKSAKSLNTKIENFKQKIKENNL